MPKHPTKKPTNDRKKVKARYQKAREDAQLVGLLPTVPDGAVRDERVNPATQSRPTFLELEAMAVAKGWPVPVEYRAEVIHEWHLILQDKDQKASVRLKAGQNLLAAYVASYRERHGDQPVAAQQTNVMVSIAERENGQKRNAGDQLGSLSSLVELLEASEAREAGTLRDAGTHPQAARHAPRLPLEESGDFDDEPRSVAG